MLFNSFEFLLFFPVIATIYFTIPHKTRWFLLLLASYYFYGSWNVQYLFLIAASTLISYFAARQIAASRVKRKRNTYLIVSILANMGPLLAFKYLDFINESISGLADLIGWNYPIEALAFLLPVGISFFTFQTLSYTIDVYNKKFKPEKHLGIFALYVSFFPQLVAGPIERPGNLIPQLRKKVNFNHQRIRDGLTQMLWGFFKKIVIADGAALIVNGIYNDVDAFVGIPLIAGTVLFAFQIYGDFSGYSDIAIGASKVFGIKLMKNFDRPYFSKSIPEFWRRWHISLSTWFRDYLYIPLGGNRVVKWRWHYNIFITFLISGLWHGAAWTFVIWGALHGAYMVVSVATAKKRKLIKEKLKLRAGSFLDKIWQVAVTFTLVNIGWVLFRANNFSDAIYVYKNSLKAIREQIGEISNFGDVSDLLNTTGDTLFAVSVGIAILLIANLIQRKPNFYFRFQSLSIYYRWPAYYALILIILFLGTFESEEFIYFQF